MPLLESGPGFRSGVAGLRRHVNAGTIGTGIVAWLFGVTGPALIVLNAAKQANMTLEQTVSWLFVIYVVGGVMSILFSLYYQQPVAAAWTIPGAVLVGAALTHLSLAEGAGAYLITGILVFLLGVSGLMKKAMEWLPVPVMMGMVAGVLLPIGVATIGSLPKLPTVGAITILTFIVVSAFPGISRRLPPVLAALVVGLVAASVTGEAKWGALVLQLGKPVPVSPQVSAGGILELAIPLTLMVVGVQNVQAIGVLNSQGYRPPVTMFTVASGVGTLVNAVFGGHPACVAGPTTAICASPASGAKEGRYVAAFVNGILWILFGLAAPGAASIIKVLPAALISILGGIAVLSVLVGTLKDAFSGPFRMGALFAFLITVSGLSLLRVGAPFWGLVGGAIVSVLVEREDFRAQRERLRRE